VLPRVLPSDQSVGAVLEVSGVQDCQSCAMEGRATADALRTCRSGVRLTRTRAATLEDIPLAPACSLALGTGAARFAATAGEDYELLVAMPPVERPQPFRVGTRSSAG